MESILQGPTYDSTRPDTKRNMALSLPPSFPLRKTWHVVQMCNHYCHIYIINTLNAPEAFPSLQCHQSTLHTTIHPGWIVEHEEHCNRTGIAGITVSVANKLLWKWWKLNQQINPDLISQMPLLPRDWCVVVVGWRPSLLYYLFPLLWPLLRSLNGPCNLLLPLLLWWPGISVAQLGWVPHVVFLVGDFGCKLFQIDLCANWSHRQCNKHCRANLRATDVPNICVDIFLQQFKSGRGTSPDRGGRWHRRTHHYRYTTLCTWYCG